jgi:transcriptional regulator of acetoin/glycerol metabolism
MCHGNQILVEHLPHHVVSQSVSNGSSRFAAKGEKEIILKALERNRGNKSRAAIELGMHRSTLWRKIKTLRIE